MLWLGVCLGLCVCVVTWFFGMMACSRCSDPHLEFSEAPAVLPPEPSSMMTADQIRAQEEELRRVAEMPLPDDDDDDDL